MATRKNNWLNAKPVTKAGGKSGGARNPAKPYNKPSSTSGTPKIQTKTQKLQQAAKTKPSSPAPRQVVKKPVTRTGPVKGPVAPKGSTGPVTLPNSRKAGVNLPQTGARAERTATRAIQPRNTVKPQTTSSRPLTAADGRPVKMDAKGWPKGTESWAAKSSKAASKAAGTAGKLAGAAGKALGAVGVVGAMASEVKAMSDRNKTFSWNRPKVKPDANGRSSTGVRVSDKANQRDYKAAPTGSQQYNDYRNQQIAAERQRLKGVGNPPAAKPKPPAPTQSGGGSTQSRGSSSAPAAPRRQPGPAADAGMKNQDKNYRGNLFEKTFGYKPGQAPDQQKSRFKSVDNKFGQDSGYEPQTKVAGSKYADKKPDMKKVKEYDRLRRKYYD